MKTVGKSILMYYIYFILKILSTASQYSVWHIIQEGKKEEDRTPDLRRCERIRWPKPIIEHCTESEIKVWENERHTKKGIQTSICIWFEQVEYLIILRKRTGFNLFWTAYPVTEAHRKRKLEKEYQCYLKKQGAP